MDGQSSYSALLQRYRSCVWSMCWRYAGGDLERCRDLVQEVSLSLWEHYGKLRKGARPWEERAWVLWHTRSVLNHICRGIRQEYVPLTPSMVASLTIDGHDEREMVNDLLSKLSESDRRLVQLRLEGYSADEIADKTGLRRDTVYQRLHRVIKRLRDQNDNEKD